MVLVSRRGRLESDPCRELGVAPKHLPSSAPGCCTGIGPPAPARSKSSSSDIFDSLTLLPSLPSPGMSRRFEGSKRKAETEPHRRVRDLGQSGGTRGPGAILQESCSSRCSSRAAWEAASRLVIFLRVPYPLHIYFLLKTGISVRGPEGAAGGSPTLRSGKRCRRLKAASLPSSSCCFPSFPK